MARTGPHRMALSLPVLLALTLLLAIPVRAHAATARTTAAEDYDQTSVIVVFPQGTTTDEARSIIRDVDGIDADSLVMANPHGTDDGIDGEVASVSTAGGASVREAIASLEATGQAQAQPNRYYHPLDVPTPTLAQATSRAYGASQLRMSPLATDVAEHEVLYSQQWYLGAVHAQDAWDVARGDASQTGTTLARDERVGIAIMDTGCRTAHLDLADNITATYNAVHAYKNNESDGEAGTLDESDVEDTHGHGTHVAGIAGAVTNNGYGIAGVSYNANLIICKVEDEDGIIDTLYLYEAYRYLLAHADELGVRVVNMSLGAGDADEAAGWEEEQFSDDLLYQQIDAAHQRGIVSVAAAGNSNGEDCKPPCGNIPGDYDNIIEAIATAPSNQRARYSNYNESSYNGKPLGPTTPNRTKDIAAPGGDANLSDARGWILSTAIDEESHTSYDAWRYKCGTSMASPVVAGVCALCLSADKSMSAADVHRLVTANANASACGQKGWSYEYGYGLVDAYAAVTHVMATASVAPLPCQASTGHEVRPALDITSAAGQKLVEGRDYSASYADNVNQGHATVTITGTGAYVGTITTGFDIGLPLTLEGQTLTYDGEPHAARASTTAQGADIRYSTDGSTYDLTEPPSITDAGTMVTYAKVSLEGQEAYAQASVTIEPREVTLASASATKTYDGLPLTAERLSVEGQGWAFGQGASYTFTGSQTNPGSSPNTFTYQLDPGTRAQNYRVTTRTGTLTVTSRSRPMHRLYNPNTGEHFYTASTGERDAVVAAGWTYEGIGWNAPETSQTPVWRLYNQFAGDHHYTQSLEERDALIGFGWTYEGVGWYSGGPTALWRQYNPNAVTGTHNYTTSARERDALVALGWKDEGVAWYGL